MSEITEEEIAAVLESAVMILQRRKAAFGMARYYWHEVLGRKFVDKPGFKVADLGTMWPVEAIPFAMGLEGKTRYDLYVAAYKRPVDLKVQVYKYDKDEETSVKKAKGNPLVARFSDFERYQIADFRKLPVDNETFDLCLMRNPNWRDLGLAEGVVETFSEIDRVLKPGGVLWMTFLQESEGEVAKKALEEAFNKKFVIKVNEVNKYPTTKVRVTDPDMGETKELQFDSFILIAEKAQ